MWSTLACHWFDYVHRIGRTGRAENEGKAITFVNPAEEYHFDRIEEIIRMKVPESSIPDEVPVPETPFKEKQGYEREIDSQKRKADPDFKGAFHEKKKYGGKPYEKEKPKRGKKNSKAKKNRNQLKTKNRKK